MPPALAARFTIAELAVLRIVADEVREHGMCDCSIEEIAARAGTSRTLVKRTLRLATRHGLLRVTERPRPGKRHDTNLVEITSAEWTAWLRRGPKHRIGVTFATPTATRDSNRASGANRTAATALEKRCVAGRVGNARRDSCGSP